MAISRRELIRKMAVASGAVALYHVIPDPGSVSGALAHTSTNGCAQASTGNRCDAMPEPPASPPSMSEAVKRSMVKESKPTPKTMNKVQKVAAAEVRRIEASGAKVVDNEDGLFAYEVVRSGERLRIALFDATTRGGTDVVGMAFLNEQQIKELEDRRSGRADNTLGLGPGVAHADVQPVDHYHYFWKCSYALQYANSWNLYVYVCSVDVDFIKDVGAALAAILGIVLRQPLLFAVGVLIYVSGLWMFRQPDGSIQFNIPGGSVTDSYGWVYYYTPGDWWWYYPEGDPNFGYARRDSDGSMWRWAS